MWWLKIVQVFKITELRNKILFVLGVFIVFRIMANIPVPGVNAENLRTFFNQFQVFGLLNAFTGGSLDRLSIVMLGLGPYITSVVVLQLLTMIFPQLEKMYKEEGEAGKKKFEQYGRIATVPLAMLNSYAMLVLFQRQNAIHFSSPITLFTAIMAITAGTVFLMWLGELITERGIGNGVSLLIFAGIVSSIPSNIRQVAVSWDASQIPGTIAFFAMSLVIIAGVVIFNESRRNIPVSYAKRVRGSKMYGGASTYLPLNVNPAGVMPVIFALSILSFPQMITSVLKVRPGLIGSISTFIDTSLYGNTQQSLIIHGALYFLLVVVFTYFYTAVTFDPKTISSNLQKMGGFIPGIRPGESTANFIRFILNRVLLIGAIFLGLIAVMPYIIQGFTTVTAFKFLVGGTSLLIVVSVVLETMRQINSQLQMREYDTF
ncbi:MAG: preprotein translocase subunit SecY [Candidatus Nealsonbacteria bacterium]|nr:preprotein translocase subunit SecY [Candidatus Nealsonbacteria bacterium]